MFKRRQVFHSQCQGSSGQLNLPEPIADGLKEARKQQLHGWLAIYLIAKGQYKLTDKAIEELGKTEEPRARIVEPGKKERMRIADAKVRSIIGNGNAAEVYDCGYAERRRDCWGDRDTRIAAIRKLVEVLGKEPGAVSTNDFRDMALIGILKRNGGSAYSALAEAGYAYPLETVLEQSENGAFGTERIYPWEMAMSPMIFNRKEFRVAATKWLIWKKGKDPKDMTSEEFEAGIRGVLPHCGGSHYLALVEAGYAHSMEEAVEHAREKRFRKDKIYAWEMAYAPDIYGEVKWRAAATTWLVLNSGKKPQEMRYDDFEVSLRGLLPHCEDSNYIALAEAGYAYKPEEVLEHAETADFKRERIYPWEMDNAPSIYNDYKFRIAATRWLIWKTGKTPKSITQDDFNENGLNGLLRSHKDFILMPFVEAGYAYSMEEAFRHAETMAFREGKVYAWEMNNLRIYDEINVRVASTRWMVWKTGKDARNVTCDDFAAYGLGRILALNGNSPFSAMEEAGLVTEADKEYMRKRGQPRRAPL
jgi:hypothetical protein